MAWGTRTGVLLGASLLAIASVSADAAATKDLPAGVIANFEITSRSPAYDGATPPGAAGPYEIITGVVHGELNPKSPLNAAVVDLKSAPVGADGMVAYSTDIVILRPLHIADAKRVLFYDVVNRGNKSALNAFIGGSALNSANPPPAGFPSLLRQGVTIVWSGWQGDVPLSGNASTAGTGSIGTIFPVAVDKVGKPLTGMSREEYIPDYSGGTANTIALSYPPANPEDRKSVVFTARQSWLTGYGTSAPGVMSYNAPSVPVTDWHYDIGPKGLRVVFTPPATVPGPGGQQVAPDGGTIYEFVYRATDPRVNGIGFAAVRDLVSFLRHDAADAQGHPNPLSDIKFDAAVGEGISQSGRMIKEFLYRGFNADGQGRPVFDGLMPIISGGRQTWTDARFSQPGRWSKQHEEHWQYGDQFPFTYNTIKDPVSGRTDGLLRACTQTRTCPKIVQTDGEYEWWGARAALVVTDGTGHDLPLPDNVRYYLVSGTRHGGGPGVTSGLYPMPAAGSLCQLPGSPVAETPVWRALLSDLIDWTASDKAPPPSQYPTVAQGTLVAPTRAATAFPDLSDIIVADGGQPARLNVGFGNYNQIFVTDYSKPVPAVSLNKPYTGLVPKTDSNGNATAGVLVPDMKVPLATYVGWNYRGAGHAVGEGCTSDAAAIPFAINAAAKNGGHDSRASLADLYKGRADYQTKVAAAANALVADRYLLQDDADNIFIAHARDISPDIIPDP